MKNIMKWLIDNKYNIDEHFTYGNVITARRILGNIEHWLKINHLQSGYMCEYIEWVGSSYGKRVQSNSLKRYQDVIIFFKNNIN